MRELKNSAHCALVPSYRIVKAIANTEVQILSSFHPSFHKTQCEQVYTFLAQLLMSIVALSKFLDACRSP